jgi:hypothetical protein
VARVAQGEAPCTARVTFNPDTYSGQFFNHLRLQVHHLG